MIKTYETWYGKYYEHIPADRAVEPFLQLPVHGPWLKRAREASFLSITRVSKNLNVSQTTYRKFENGEADGTISLANLKRCAEAMDCELVYAIRPKNRKPFSDSVWQALTAAVSAPGSIYQICEKMYDERFRLQQGWCRNTSLKSHEYIRLLKANRDVKRQYNTFTGKWP